MRRMACPAPLSAMYAGKPSRNRVCLVAHVTENLIEQAVNCIHSVWPAWARAIPDFTDDDIHKNEHKLAVPGYSQLDPYSCGATAGWAVVKTFHRTGIGFRKFYGDCDPQPFDGTTEGKLVKSLRCNGIGVSVRSNLNYIRIRAAIESGFPVITTIGHEYSDGAHWVVIYGIGWRPRRVFLCNQVNFGWPGFSRAELTWEDFRNLWNPRGGGLVCWGKRLAR